MAYTKYYMPEKPIKFMRIDPYTRGTS
jgi:hypothetical protein